ncbi:MAG TPA: carbamoyltransferase [Verrucomicrobiae bacterium]|jgi:carbamoyltransferase|nr:carbamoyltransferase [Verrucomicrobiae bacterium]
MTSVLGISAFYHDSAAALVVDGRIVAAAQEERFTRRKHDPDFPAQAAAYCLREAGLQPGELDYVAFYEKPFQKFDRLLETYFAFAPAGFASFREAMPVWWRDKLYLRRKLREELKTAKRARFIFTEHHESHAASAFFPSPFDDAAILTVDGVGEWTTATLGVGEGNRLRLLRELKFPHSLGLLYSAFTYYCGFKVNSGEYKLMGLAPYGQPRFADAIREHLLDLRPDGSFRMNMDYFNYCQGLTMTNDRFHRLFGGPPRSPESQLEQRHMDLAASIQVVTEEIFIAMARELHRLTGKKNLVLAGGVALNCVANGRLLREGPFSNLWLQPAAGDAGGALGAALFVWNQLLENPRQTTASDSQAGSFLGPRFSNHEIEKALNARSLPCQQIDDEEILLKQIVDALIEGKVVGWFHGRMEFGPRALGARSILGDARNPAMQAVMNVKIKYRESFRPFAPCILRERAADYFALPRQTESPYMLIVAPLLEQHRTPLSDAQRNMMATDPDLRHRVNIARSTVPAITHVDYSARIQTVDEQRHGRFYRLLKMFEQQTGCPMLVNTSFNVRGEPIVCTPDDAARCFLATDMDLLVLENFIADKKQIAHLPSATEKAEHLAAFQPD